MIINGNELALGLKNEIKEGVKNFPQLSLAVVVVKGNQSTTKYIQKKKQFGEEVGIKVDLIEFDPIISTEDLISKIEAINHNENYQGLIVQLPLPAHIDVEQVLKSVDNKKDVDALKENTIVLSPVVGAIAYIFEKYQIDFTGKKVVVLGHGKLVGIPAVKWLKSKNITPTVIDRNTTDLDSNLKQADIIISGAGSPGLIRPDNIKEGVIIIDAGTSEDSGRLAGDALPECAVKASLFTPVPGGVGPMTIAIIFKNLLDLAKRV